VPLAASIKSRARREIHQAAEWWQQNRPSAPGAVAEDLRHALELLCEFPGIGTRVANSRDPETRRWHLKRLGYDLYYRQRGEVLEVIAFWHGSRASAPSV
jgi:plasmid stabilization system protein ParE